MADINFREHIIGLVKPLLPKSWKLMPTGLNDAPQQMTVELFLQKIERLPDSPQGYRLATYTLNIIAPGPSDDAIDDAVIDLVNAIDDVPNLQWEGAERGLWPVNGPTTYPCYTLTLTYPFIKE